MSVYTKLNEARAKFHALKLEKTGHNKFAGYNYFELGDFLIPALQVFNQVGLCAIVSFDKELATMRIVDTQPIEAPHHITITSPMGSAALKGCHEIQNIGACETYCRRYLWVTALEIVEHDALDATTGNEQKEKTAPEPTPLISKERQAELDDCAMTMSALQSEGREMEASKMYYALPHNHEKLYVWKFFKGGKPGESTPGSRMRAFIKANQPNSEPVAYQPSSKEMQE